jgi:hypothetical protein
MRVIVTVDDTRDGLKVFYDELQIGPFDVEPHDPMTHVPLTPSQQAARDFILRLREQGATVAKGVGV